MRAATARSARAGTHSCGLRSDGGVVCWGWNTYGRTEAPAGRYSQVNAGWDHSCGLRSDGGVVCWGRNSYGQREAPSGRYSQVSAGYFHSCGLRSDGGVVCWGANEYGQAEAPTGRYSQVSAGWDHSCGLRSDGGVVCWGRNRDGQTEAPSGRYSQVSAGEDHSCGLRSDGGVVCWGANLFANLHAAGDRIFAREQGHVSDEVNGRIVARRLADGRTEFGFQPEGAERILPRSRYFPANARVDRWLQSSPVTVDDQEIGRINARLLADGRIEFALRPVDGERILPRSRYFPATARVDRWLRSSLVELE